jgi:hypothetical protein
MAVVVAVQAVAEDGDSAKVIDGGCDADVDEFLVGGVAVGDVGRRDVGGCPGRPGGVIGTWL